MDNNSINLTDSISLGTFIRDYRKSQNLTQEEVAGLSGTGIRFIVDLEKGKSTCQIQKILDVIKVLGLNLRLEN